MCGKSVAYDLSDKDDGTSHRNSPCTKIQYAVCDRYSAGAFPRLCTWLPYLPSEAGFLTYYYSNVRPSKDLEHAGSNSPGEYLAGQDEVTN